FTQKNLPPPKIWLIVRLPHDTIIPKKDVTSLYPQILAYLIEFIKYQEKIIKILIILVFGKAVGSVRPEQPINKEYRKFKVDELPINQRLEKVAFQDIKESYFDKHGKELKPVRRHAKSKSKVPENLCCPK